MIEVWGIQVMAQVEDVLETLRIELRESDSILLKDMKKTFKNIMVTCPAHGEGQEKKPSCGVSMVDTRRNDGKGVDPAGTVHCFTCGYTANLPEFVSFCFGHNDKGMFGYKWIASRYIQVEVENRQPLVLDMERNKVKEEPIYISDKELEKYRYTHEYMYFRKLNDKVIEYFDVGWDKETDCITFPVKDLSGRVVLIQRRAVKGKFFKNDNTVRGEYIYGLYEVYKNLDWIKEVRITESIIDALYSWTVRKPAVALMSALPTAAQIKLLKEVPIRKFVECLDRDEAGRRAAKRLQKELGTHKLVYSAVFPSDVKDLNELSPEELVNLQSSILC